MNFNDFFPICIVLSVRCAFRVSQIGLSEVLFLFSSNWCVAVENIPLRLKTVFSIF